MQKIYLMKDRKIKGRAKGRGWHQDLGAAPREGMAPREEGVALMEGTASKTKCEVYILKLSPYIVCALWLNWLEH